MMREQVLEMIQRDLAAFADAGTAVEISDRAAIWQQNRRTMDIEFTRGDDELPRIQFQDRQFSYREFFASEAMADVPILAESIHQSLRSLPVYVDAPASPEGSEDTVSATELLHDLAVEDLPYGATRVVFVRGSAGAGKTVALRQLALNQAGAVAAAKSSKLFFYIDAQARALARLDEAVALLLQDLGARFTYRALSTLTRLGLVIPIIDGFDELLGAGGYGEAFDSLAKFLARLDGRGSLIASARSTFYEYRDFRESASRFERRRSLNFEISPVDVKPWTRKEVAEYLDRAGAVELLDSTTGEMAAKVLEEKLGPQGTSFLRTPFFVATLAELLQQGAQISAEERIVPQVIGHFISRERDKLRDHQDVPVLNDDGHRRFLEMLAEEMWWQGGRELDSGTVKAMAELVAEAVDLDPRSRVIFVERSPSYAFFENREHEGRGFLGFTHEYYYAFFMGQFLARCVVDKDSLDQLLTRARMSPLFGDEFAHASVERGYDIEEIVNTLSFRTVRSLTREMNRVNAGVLYGGLLRVTPGALVGQPIRDAEFIHEDLGETKLERVSFSRCELVRARFVGAQWSEIGAEETRFVEPVVDEHTTNLGNLSLRVGSELVGIVVIAGQQESTVYDPAQMHLICGRIGIQIAGDAGAEETALSEEAKKIIDLLRKFCRIAARLFYISDDDLETRGVSKSSLWKELESMLIDYDLLEFVSIQRRGPENRVRRLRVLPSELEQGESGEATKAEIARFWTAVRRL